MIRNLIIAISYLKLHITLCKFKLLFENQNCTKITLKMNNVL